MAIFSYHTQHIGKRHYVMVSHEGGEVPNNLLGVKEQKLGLDFTGSALLDAFESRYRAELGQLKESRDAQMGLPGVQEMSPLARGALNAVADAASTGRLYVLETTPEEQPDLTRRLTRFFEERGHTFRPRREKASLYLVKTESGDYTLAAPAVWAITTANTLFRSAGRHQVTELLPLPGHPGLVRLVMDGDPVKAAQAMAAGASSSLHVVNLTKEPILNAPAELETTQPYLVSGERGVEFCLTEGNLCDVERALDPRIRHEIAPGAWVLRGSAAEQAEAVKAAKGKVKLNGYRITYSRDIREEQPTPVVASDAHLVVGRDRIEAGAISPEAKERVAALQLKNFTLEPAQQECAAFAIDRPRAVLAVEVGGGKTAMTAAAGFIRNQDTGGKTMVVCPPGIIPQWVRVLDRHFPMETGGVPGEVPTPPWFRRLSPRKRRELAEPWARVSKHFVFLPESALQSGVKVHRRKLMLADGVEASKQAQGAIDTLQEIMEQPVTSVIVDECQGFRVGGEKFELLSSMLENGVKGKFDVQNVILASATPLHRDAPDLYPLLRLLGIRKFQNMDIQTFCAEYCQRKVQAVNGQAAFVPPVAPYGYGMLKEEKVAEIAELLSGCMISRTKFQIAPDRSRPLHIECPLPYEPCHKLGIALPNMHQKGDLIPPAPELADDLERMDGFAPKAIRLAQHKVPSTVAKVKAELAALPPEEKLVVFTSWVSVANAISADLKSAGVRNHMLHSQDNIAANGQSMPVKQDLIDDFIEGDAASRVLVATTGAGGTGVDGLHRVAHTAIHNDLSIVAGTDQQANGRVWRIEEKILDENAAPARIIKQICDHPLDRALYKIQLDRQHEAAFIYQNGSAMALDTEETKAAKEIRRHHFAGRVLRLVGRTPGPMQVNGLALAGARVTEEGIEPVAPAASPQNAPTPLPAMDPALAPITVKALRAAAKLAGPGEEPAPSVL